MAQTFPTTAAAGSDAKRTVVGAVAPGNVSGPGQASSAANGGAPERSNFSLRRIFRRKDNLPAGSGAAAVADRESARIRKAEYRAKKRAEKPAPPLPSAAATPGQIMHPGTDPNRGPLAAPAASAPAIEPPLQWIGADLAPVCDPAPDVLEEMLHTEKFEKLRKAKIDPALIKEIERDFAWPKNSKLILAKTGANVGAKWLNRFGISAAYKDEVNFGAALLIIVKHESALNRRLDKLIAAAEKAASANSAPAPSAAAPAPKFLRLDEVLSPAKL